MFLCSNQGSVSSFLACFTEVPSPGETVQSALFPLLTGSPRRFEDCRGLSGMCVHDCRNWAMVASWAKSCWRTPSCFWPCGHEEGSPQEWSAGRPPGLHAEGESEPKDCALETKETHLVGFQRASKFLIEQMLLKIKKHEPCRLISKHRHANYNSKETIFFASISGKGFFVLFCFVF